MLRISHKFQVPLSELELSYVRSSGPGGQNVNKVNSKAVLRWNVFLSPSLRVETREKLLRRLEAQISRDGDIVISSDRYRDQIRNREDCFNKFQDLIAAALIEPKARRKTKPSFSSIRKAKESKSKHSKKKNLRKISRHDD